MFFLLVWLCLFLSVLHVLRLAEAQERIKSLETENAALKEELAKAKAG